MNKKIKKNNVIDFLVFKKNKEADSKSDGLFLPKKVSREIIKKWLK